MAGSRVHKIGTIFSRTTGLLRSGAMKDEDKPLWYDLYRAFPPKLEPRIDRPVVPVDIKQIFYPEDVIRAKFYKIFGTPAAVNMSNDKQPTASQRFVETFLALQQAGEIEEDDLFDAAAESLRGQGVFLAKPKSETDSQESESMTYSIKSDLTTVVPASPIDEPKTTSHISKR